MSAAGAGPRLARPPRGAGRLGARRPLLDTLRRAPAAAGLAGAIVLAGCATGPAPTPLHPTVLAPSSAAAPSAEAFGGLRFDASRTEVMRRFPGADCGGDHCAGAVRFVGLPASFFVFGEPDGRWVASVSVSDATPPSHAFAVVSDALHARYPQPADVEQGGNQLRWRLDAAGRRQVLMRRCVPARPCRGGARTVLEVDFFEQGPPPSRPW